MIIVLFHVLYLLGKFVYKNYRLNKDKAVEDDNTERLEITESIYNMIDPEAPQDDKKTNLRFYPPAYVQRYRAVADILSDTKYEGQLCKIVDFGCAQLDFLVYLKHTPGIEEILCVDIDGPTLEQYEKKAEPLVSEYIHCRSTPLLVEVCEGSVVHNDSKLENTDAVICIELIEHLYPETLRDFPTNVFGFIKPKVVIITTPNADFNVLFPNLSGFRHYDHKFEWTRQQFQDWAEDIVRKYPDYLVSFDGICKGPENTEHLGCCTQMAIFDRCSEKTSSLPGIEGLFKSVAKYEYPCRIDNRSDEQKILDEVAYQIRRFSSMQEDFIEELPLERLLQMLYTFNVTMGTLRTVLVEGGWSVVDRDTGPVVLVLQPSVDSDYNFEEEDYWDNITDDDDEWSSHPGPPVSSNDLLEGEYAPSNNWSTESWEEEPSIIIPQNNPGVPENSYFYDGENLSLLQELGMGSENTESFGEPEEANLELASNSAIVSAEHVSSDRAWMTASSPKESFARKNATRDFNEVALQEEMEEDCLDDSMPATNGQDGTQNCAATQRLNRMLDFQALLSNSRSSTSPEPFLLESIQMDEHWRNESILNNTFEQFDASASQNESDANNLRSIYFNASYNEREDSDTDLNFPCSANTLLPPSNSASTSESGAQFETGDGSSTTRQDHLGDKDSLESTSRTSVRNNSDAGASSSSNASYTALERWIVDEARLVNQTGELVLKGGSEMANDSSDSTIDALSNNASTIVFSSNEEEMPKKKKSSDRNTLSNLVDGASTRVGCSSSALEKWTKEREEPSDDRVDARVNSQSINLSLTIKSGLNAAGQARDQNEETKTESRANITLDAIESCSRYAKECEVSNIQSTSVLKNDPRNEQQQVEPCCVQRIDLKAPSPEAQLETPPNSWSPEIMDSGYPNSASAQDMTPEYDLSSIAQDRVSDSESPSVAEAPRLGLLEAVEVENGDLANNNRDGEGNNMIAVEEVDDLEDLQPLIDVLENDLENENDIYAPENDFPVWLLRILEMANPADRERLREHGELPLPDPDAGGDLGSDRVERDEGFDGSSSSDDESDSENNETDNDDASEDNENAVVANVANERENSLVSDWESNWAAGDT